MGAGGETRRLRGLGAIGIAGLLLGCTEPTTYGSQSTDTGTSGTTGTQTDTGTPEASCEGLVSIAPGTFSMGCHDDLDPPCADDANPLHEVVLAAFEIDRCEVSVAQYDACIEQGGCTERPAAEACNSASLGKANHPVNCVSWEQAATFCEWAGGTLPTEAQWERAARGLGTRVYPWGDDEEQACTRAVMGGDCASGGTEPVGTHPAGASPDHLMDMAGNVTEWVFDWYDPGYYESSPESDPTGPDTGTERVIRGGHFSSALSEIRTLTRAAGEPTEALPVYGLRCVYAVGGDGGTDTGTGGTSTDSTGATDTGSTDSDATETGSGDTGSTSTSSGTSTDPTGTGTTTP